MNLDEDVYNIDISDEENSFIEDNIKESPKND
jgi:hypothetical protein